MGATMSASESRRRRIHYERARLRWRESNPVRPFELTDVAVYVAPPELRPVSREAPP
jgi:hypothetical protein